MCCGYQNETKQVLHEKGQISVLKARVPPWETHSSRSVRAAMLSGIAASVSRGPWAILYQ